jgi:hypothetical protein
VSSWTCEDSYGCERLRILEIDSSERRNPMPCHARLVHAGTSGPSSRPNLYEPSLATLSKLRPGSHASYVFAIILGPIKPGIWGPKRGCRLQRGFSTQFGDFLAWVFSKFQALHRTSSRLSCTSSSPVVVASSGQRWRFFAIFSA